MAESAKIFCGSFLEESVVFVQESDLNQEGEAILVQEEDLATTTTTDSLGTDILQHDVVGVAVSSSGQTVELEGQPDVGMLENWTTLEEAGCHTGLLDPSEHQEDCGVETLTLVLEDGADLDSVTRQFALATGGDLDQAEQQIRAILLTANRETGGDNANGIQFLTSDTLAEDAAPTFLTSDNSCVAIGLDTDVDQTWTEPSVTDGGSESLFLVDSILANRRESSFESGVNQNRDDDNQAPSTTTEASPTMQTEALLVDQYETVILGSELDFVTELQPPSTIEAETKSLDDAADRVMSHADWNQLDSSELEITATSDGPFSVLDTSDQAVGGGQQLTAVEPDSLEMELPAQFLQKMVGVSEWDGAGGQVLQVTAEDSHLLNMLGSQGTIFLDMDSNRQGVLRFVNNAEEPQLPNTRVAGVTDGAKSPEGLPESFSDPMAIDNVITSEQLPVKLQVGENEPVQYTPLRPIASLAGGRGRLPVRPYSQPTRGRRLRRASIPVRPVVRRDSDIVGGSGARLPPPVVGVRQPAPAVLGVGGVSGRAYSRTGGKAQPVLREKLQSAVTPSVANRISSCQQNVQKLNLLAGQVQAGGAAVDLINTTQSAISPQNMEAIIQILQSLPRSAQGQTIQVVLQNATSLPKVSSVLSDSATTRQETQTTPPTPMRTSSVKRFRKERTTSDIAIQVSPEFIEPVVTDVGAAIESPLLDEYYPVDGSEDGVLNSVTSAILDEMQMDTSDMQNVDLFDCVTLPIQPTPVTQNKAGSVKRRRIKADANKIVTVKQDYVVDPTPGVSYYAVIDYLSEPEQQESGTSTSDRRWIAASSFMEDHLELLSLPGEAKGRSVLESTVGSHTLAAKQRRSSVSKRAPSCTKTPPPEAGHLLPVKDGVIDLPPMSNHSNVTLSESAPLKQAEHQLETSGNAVADEMVAARPRKRRSRSVRNLSDRKEYRCGYCHFSLGDKIEVVEHCIREHPQMPIKTMSLSAEVVGRICPYCKKKFEYAEFFTHMRFEHNDVHPYKCGYCEFMARDRNQVRHHIQKKHRLPPKVVDMTDAGQQQQQKKKQERASDGRRRIMAASEGEDSVYEYLTDEEEDFGDEEDEGPPRDLSCPECGRTFKILKYLKTHIKVHQAHRYQCGYCDFLSVMMHQVIQHCHRRHTEMEPRVLTKELDSDKHPVVSRDMESLVRKVYSLNTRLPRDPDAAKWMRKWCCPHCDYTCQFGASFRRHIKMHENKLPYKCNYCSFKGREKYYVRRHIYRVHQNVPFIVVENTAENRACDTSSDEDFQQKGLRRKRRRRTKMGVRSVVPLESMDDTEFLRQFLKLPVGKRGKREKRSQDNVPRKKRTPRLPRAKEWTGQNVEDYVQDRRGDQVVCNVCSESVHTMAFSRHAQNHFKVKPRPFKCGHCNFMSIEQDSIRTHCAAKHKNAPFRIEECRLASVAPRDFLQLLGGGGRDEGSRLAADATEDDTPQLCCSLCQATVPCTDLSLREHFYAHYNFRPYECNLCDFRGVTEESVFAHGDKHAAPVLVRRIDGEPPDGLEDAIQYFLQEGRRAVQLQARVRPNLLQAPHLFHCPLCNQTFKLQVVSVRRHLYNHFQYKPWKCGYCPHLGVSKAKIKKHSTVHGGVAARVEFVGDDLPVELAELLAKIMGSAQGVTEILPVSRQNPITDEGKQWKEKLARAECPMCRTQIVGPVYVHLAEHFNRHPFCCGHCREGFSSEVDARQHCEVAHPNLDPNVVTNLPIEDEAVIRQGLLRYLKSCQREAPNGSTAIKNASQISGEPSTADKTNDGRPDTDISIQIFNEDGVVVGNTQAIIHTVTSIDSSAVDEDGTAVPEVDVITLTDTAAAIDASKECGTDATAAAEKTEKSVLPCTANIGNRESSSGLNLETSNDGDVERSTRVTAAESEGTSAEVAEALNERLEPDASVSTLKRGREVGCKDGSSADIVTVEGVLLTRSFRSETEASDDEDSGETDVGGGSSFGGQGSGFSDDDRDSSSSNNEHSAEEEDDWEDDDHEEMLVSNLTSDFFSDVITLLKQQRELQQPTPDVPQEPQVVTPAATVAGAAHSGLECNICHWRFSKMASLEEHVSDVHGPKEVTTDFDPNQFGIQAVPRPPRRRRIATSVSNVSRKRKSQPGAKPLTEGPTQDKRGRLSLLELSVSSETETASTQPPVTDPNEEEEETVENITKMLNEHIDAESSSSAVTVNSDCPDSGTTVSPTDVYLNEHETGVCELLSPQTSASEITTRSDLLQLAASDADDHDAALDGLENLEECDANLPKILQILQLRPHDKNDSS